MSRFSPNWMTVCDQDSVISVRRYIRQVINQDRYHTDCVGYSFAGHLSRQFNKSVLPNYIDREPIIYGLKKKRVPQLISYHYVITNCKISILCVLVHFMCNFANCLSVSKVSPVCASCSLCQASVQGCCPLPLSV